MKFSKKIWKFWNVEFWKFWWKFSIENFDVENFQNCWWNIFEIFFSQKIKNKIFEKIFFDLEKIIFFFLKKIYINLKFSQESKNHTFSPIRSRDRVIQNFSKEFWNHRRSYCRAGWPLRGFQKLHQTFKWPMIADDWPMIADDWPMIADDWPMIADDWPMIADDCPMIDDDWPMIADDWPIGAWHHIRQTDITHRHRTHEHLLFDQSTVCRGHYTIGPFGAINVPVHQPPPFSRRSDKLCHSAIDKLSQISLWNAVTRGASP